MQKKGCWCLLGWLSMGPAFDALIASSAGVPWWIRVHDRYKPSCLLCSLETALKQHRILHTIASSVLPLDTLFYNQLSPQLHQWWSLKFTCRFVEIDKYFILTTLFNFIGNLNTLFTISSLHSLQLNSGLYCTGVRSFYHIQQLKNITNKPLVVK